MERKRCKRCGKKKPLSDFHHARPGQFASRCKQCHGKEERTCVICGGLFFGLSSKILCSQECRKKYRPQTFKDCAHCGSRFGPVNRLSQKFCCYPCKAAAMKTGRRVVWVSTPAAKAAHLEVRYALRRGDIIRPQKCENCGKVCKPNGAHHDYKKPLDVRWLCGGCHVEWDHAKPKGGAVRQVLR